MKKIFKDFLDSVVQLIASAVEEKIKHSQIKVHHRSSIDQLIRVCENTVFQHKDVVVKIMYRKSSGYMLQLWRGESPFYQTSGHPTQKQMYEIMLQDLVRLNLK